MLYSKLVEIYNDLEKTSKKLEKTAILTEFFKKLDSETLSSVVLLSMGRIFPTWDEREVGIASNLVIKAISRATGISENEIKEFWKNTGDLGDAAKIAVSKKKQITLMKKELTIKKVHENFIKISEITGSGAIDRKLSLLSELLTSSSPEEAKYIVRTILGELRVGVAEGIVRDAIANAFNVPNEVVERAYNLTNDFSEVARVAKEKGEKGLLSLSMKIGRPIKVMLAQKAENIEEGFEKVGRPAACEFKYDGFRMQIHKEENKFILFTRRLENVTKQFPDLIEFLKKSINVKSSIVEGEVTGIDEKTGRTLPFQNISKRIKRKYNINKMAKEIPVIVNLFDVIYVDGKNLINESFKERRKILESIVIPNEKVVLAKQLITESNEEASKFYKEALDSGNEGIMMKNLNAPYKPGSRVGYMIKIKPIMETLDLVIVGAEWGEGKRAKWLSSFHLACRDKNTGEFLEIGKLGTGLSDEQFEKFTEILKPLITSEKGREVKIKPAIVVEVGYEEIQRSPKYPSGYALRFPRLISLREDRSPEECDDIERVKKLFESQKK